MGRTSTSAIVCCLGARTNPAPLDSPLAWGGLLLGATPGRLCVHAWTPYVPVRLPAGGTPSADCSLAHGPPKKFRRRPVESIVVSSAGVGGSERPTPAEGCPCPREWAWMGPGDFSR